MKIFKKILFFSLIAVLTLGSGVGMRAFRERTIGKEPEVVRQSSPQEKAVEEKIKLPEIYLLFVGDIMLDRGVKWKVDSQGGDYRFPFLNIAALIRNVDLIFGNLEGPLSDKGKEVGNLYSFRMPLQALEGLTTAGFDILSLANNHIGDWGREALEDTITNLRRIGIETVGAGESEEAVYSPKILEIKGVRFAFLAFADFESQYKNTDVKNNIAFAEESKIMTALGSVKQKADIVITYFHFGDEYVNEPNDRQRKFARLAIDSGADLVIGSHPHVIQPLETYEGKYIAYSLGNFVFDQNFSKETMTGGLLKVLLEGSDIVSVSFHEVRLNEDFQPVLE